MGEKRVRISDIARTTGISRNMLSKLYYDRAKRIELNDLEKLCRFFDCQVPGLLLWAAITAVSGTAAKAIREEDPHSSRRLI